VIAQGQRRVHERVGGLFQIARDALSARIDSGIVGLSAAALRAQSSVLVATANAIAVSPRIRGCSRS
jgi:hypothetical protein